MLENNCGKINIFGYPAMESFENKMYGMESIDNDFVVKIYSKTNQKYLEQKEIDTSRGQSGSVLWIKPNKTETIIFGIHGGGNKKKKYNIATLLDENILYHINKIMF